MGKERIEEIFEDNYTDDEDILKKNTGIVSVAEGEYIMLVQQQDILDVCYTFI